MKYYVSRIGLAKGSFYNNELPPRYSRKQRNKRGGNRIGSSNEFNLDGEYLTLKSTAGYAKNNADGKTG